MITHGELQYAIEFIFTFWLGFLVVAFIVGSVTFFTVIVRNLKHEKQEDKEYAVELIQKIQKELERPQLFSERNGYAPYDRTYALTLLKLLYDWVGGK